MTYVEIVRGPDPETVEAILRQRMHDKAYALVGGSDSLSWDQIQSEFPAEKVMPGDIILKSSGSSGSPKLIKVPSSLVMDSVVSNHPCKVWGLTFAPYRMAGLQVIAQAVATNSKLISAPIDFSPSDLLNQFGEQGCQGISATPTFWRLAGSIPKILSKSLLFLSLGGEPVGQSLLDRLKAEAPASKISHIYATTETGAVFSVSDGLAGFPASYLGKPFRNGKSIHLEDGEIWVKVPSLGDQFHKTGDYVFRQGDRYLFDGRRHQHINVGGIKVSLASVEREASEFPGVRDCQALAMPSPFLGTVVELNVVWVDKDDHGSLFSYLKSRLPREALPVRINSVSKIAITQAMKKATR